MPETATARILPFPTRSETPLSADQALGEGRQYLSLLGSDDAPDRREALLAKPDVLLSVCALLREQVDGSASLVFEEAIALYKSINASSRPLGSFDERDFFLGDLALLAATACRVLGKRSDAELWLDRAEAGFRHTVNPLPLLANVTYQRLALRCETGRYEEVIELSPMLGMSFTKLNMPVERAKCVFLEAVALKETGNHEAAVGRFETLTGADVGERDPGLAALALGNLADIHVSEGRHNQAAAAYAGALPLLKQAKRPAALAHIKSVMGETLQRQGRTAAAIASYRASVEDYEALGMRTWVAYVRVLLAQALLGAGYAREAEWQLLAALPTIDEEKMVPEGFAAVALLRESVRLRKTDLDALRELREHLKANN
ncbi:MAG: hypothetical protein WEB59_05925 [Thermoanaerobaculia bacterium]